MDRALVAEVQSYVGFTSADSAILARLHPTAKLHFAAIADEFYALVRIHEGAFALLRDEAQARRLNASLRGWLDELLVRPRDDAYIESRVRIGRVHVGLGLDGRYAIAAMGRIRESLQRVAEEAFAGEQETTRSARLAVARACDLDLAIILDGYKDDFNNRIRRAREENEANRGASDGRRRDLSDALEAADVVVLWFDRSARLCSANRKAELLTGYAFDELAAANVFEVLFGDQAAPIKARWLAASDGHPLEMEAELRTRSGKTKTLRWHATAHHTEKDDDGSVVVVGVDMTKERELERRARQNERLAAAGALAAGLAHEIRNPLNGASLHLSVLDRSLARSPDVPPLAREATDVLRAEIKRLSGLVTGFLEVARPRPLARAAVDVNDLARSVAALLALEAEAQHKTLAIEPCPLPATAELDIERVKQVMINLVRNGLDAVGEGGRVVVRVRRLPHHVEIDVEDDGRGIPDPAAPIFDAFYTTKERGTGLGLSIVHRIATDHGGDVRFDSRPGSTVFTVRIPADAGAEGSGT